MFMDTNRRRENLLRRCRGKELIAAVMTMLAIVPRNVAARRQECHGAGVSLACEDEVNALLPVSHKEVDVENLDLAAKTYHIAEDHLQEKVRHVMENKQ